MASLLLKSAYELAREENIRRNQAVLAALGVPAAAEQLAPATEPRAPRPKKPRPAPGPPSRASKRQRGEEAPGQSPVREASGDSRPEASSQVWVDEAVYDELVRRHRARADRFVANPTMNYREALEHTYMRVRTMTVPKLLVRVKAIERAAGANSLQKMRVFAEVLIIEGIDEVAEEAEAALGRLLALPKFKAMFVESMDGAAGETEQEEPASQPGEQPAGDPGE